MTSLAINSPLTSNGSRGSLYTGIGCDAEGVQSCRVEAVCTQALAVMLRVFRVEAVCTQVLVVMLRVFRVAELRQSVHRYWL